MTRFNHLTTITWSLLLLLSPFTFGQPYPRGGGTWRGPKGDPAAVSIDYQLVGKTHPTKGTIRVVGTVKNIGGGPYRHGGFVGLYEMSPTGAAQLVAKTSFPSLRRGQSVQVSYQRSWFTQWTFPPSYRLIVGLDPDRPDDNMTNNSIARSGHDANKVFAPLRIAPMPRPQIVLPAQRYPMPRAQIVVPAQSYPIQRSPIQGHRILPYPIQRYPIQPYPIQRYPIGVIRRR